MLEAVVVALNPGKNFFSVVGFGHSHCHSSCLIDFKTESYNLSENNLVVDKACNLGLHIFK